MTIPPIRRELVVDATPAVAYDLFTTHLGAWWPLADFGVHGAGATVAFEADGRIVDRAPDGAATCWGEVLSWQPPSLVSFSWHPGDQSRSSTVTVTFESQDAQTLVALEHRGWEVYADPEVARAEYGHGWPVVLERYGAYVAGMADDAGTATWVALVHTPGPAAPIEGVLTEHPLFAEHVAFLHRMQGQGYLVAAGPLEDRPGDGMTILRLPGTGRQGEAARLATEDDLSVAKGLLDVAVRPWQVMFTAAG